MAKSVYEIHISIFLICKCKMYFPNTCTMKNNCTSSI